MIIVYSRNYYKGQNKCGWEAWLFKSLQLQQIQSVSTMKQTLLVLIMKRTVFLLFIMIISAPVSHQHPISLITIRKILFVTPTYH